MLEAIEKLLVLQERDRRVLRTRGELADIGPQRRLLQEKLAASQAGLEAARLRARQLESERKRLELDVQAKEQLIAKYATQQLQTKSNDEYRAFANQINTCRRDIQALEDEELGVMEKLEAAERTLAAASAEARQLKAGLESQLALLDQREVNLKQQLAEAEALRKEFAATVDAAVLPRYERLLASKGERVLVGVEHGVCGGCHMRLSRQTVLDTRAGQQLVTCPNCGRMLYFTSDMDLTER
jgi:hypothetical protein